MRPFRFVHIQKTGGTSVRAMLGLPQTPPDKHRSAAELRSAMGASEWSRHFTFAMVRNPWDRLVSCWTHIQQLRGDPNVTGFQRYVLTTAATFEDFILRATSVIRDPDGDKCVHRDQTSYLVDEKGIPLVSFIGRFERFETDLRHIADEIGVTLEAIPRLNAWERLHYSTFYSPQTRDAVARSYARDLEWFGYRFEGPP